MELNAGATIVIVVALVCSTVLGLYFLDLKYGNKSKENQP